MSTAPILEFDSERDAIIEPSAWHQPIDGLAPQAVMTWMPDAFERLIDEYPSVLRHRFQAETIDSPIYEVQLDQGPVCVTLASVGAPAALYEALIAFGCMTIIAVGSSGGLLAEHAPGTVVVPDAAIRDEGVSYHYAAPARLAHPDPALQQQLRAAYRAAGREPVTGHVWTTDALFRETASKVAARIDEGAIAVDMEASALATIARFRNVRHGHALYLADTLHGDEWDPNALIVRDTPFRLELLLSAARTAAAS